MLATVDSIPQLTEQAALDGLFATLSGRFAAGCPFTTERGAFQGYEDISQIGPWVLGLSFSSFTKVLSLTAYDRPACIQAQPLAIATRKGRGLYEVTVTLETLQRWAWQQGISRPAPIAPDRFVNDLGYTDAELAAPPTAEYMRIVAQAQQAQPVPTVQPAGDPPATVATPEAQPLTIFDLARRAIEAPGFTLQVGKRRPLWHSVSRKIDLYRRPTDNLVCLTASNNTPGAITSRPIACCPGGRWQLMAGAEANYKAWQQAVSANLRQAA